MSNLPIDGRSQEIGRLAARALSPKLPKTWIEKELDGDTDFGIDYLVQLKTKDNSVSYSFYLQLKGTISPSYIESNHFITHEFETSTLNYYKNQEPLVMVAIVDLKNNEDELHKCPIYYHWLDQQWFEEAKEKLVQNKTITIRIPVSSKINNQLDIYDYYHERVQQSQLLNQLNRVVTLNSTNPQKSIKSLTQTIETKPILLDVVEEQDDKPWISNPKGSLALTLQETDGLIKTNKINKANQKLEQVNLDDANISDHELAEVFYQKGRVAEISGEDKKAFEYFSEAYKNSKNNRYKHCFIEGLCNRSASNKKYQQQLVALTDSLKVDNYENCLLKAKCLAILKKPQEAIDLINQHYPDGLIGLLIIHFMIGDQKELGKVIGKINLETLHTEREQFIYHLFVGIYSFYLAYNIDEFMNVKLTLIVDQNCDIELLKVAFEHHTQAWLLAKALDYPSDTTLLFSFSPILFSYFNQTATLISHLNTMFDERPNHIALRKCYAELVYNNGEYDKTTVLLSPIKEDLGEQYISMFLQAHFFTKRYDEFLQLIKEYECILIENKSANADYIFCMAADAAEINFDSELRQYYIDILNTLEKGPIILDISKFIKAIKNATSNQNTTIANELYEKYQAPERPAEIATQLMHFYDPNDKEQAAKIIQLTVDIQNDRNLTHEENLKLTYAHNKLLNWREVEILAKASIELSYDAPAWFILHATALINQNKLNEAFQVLEPLVLTGDWAIKQAELYTNLCLRTGRWEDAEGKLRLLLSSTTKSREKTNLLATFVSICSSDEKYHTKLGPAIEQYGMAVDQDNAEEEGLFLQQYLMLTTSEFSNVSIDPQAKEQFSERLGSYTQRFPNSKMFKMMTLSENPEPEQLLADIEKIIGITETERQRQNDIKQKITKRELPIPFYALHEFLSDGRDIYTNWAISKHSTEEKPEYKIWHAKLNSVFDARVIQEEDKMLLIDETALLLLNELALLDTLLTNIPKFALAKDVFDNLAPNAHPTTGSIHHQIPKTILATINKHLDKLSLEDSSAESHLLEKYQSITDANKFVLLTEDQNLQEIAGLSNNHLVSINLSNILQWLFDESKLNINQVTASISQFCQLGIYQPSIDINLLAEAFISSAQNQTTYLNGTFSPVYRKLFLNQTNNRNAMMLLFQLLYQVAQKNHSKISPDFLLELFEVFKNDVNSDLSLFEILAQWFVFMCYHNEVIYDDKNCTKSKPHSNFWSIYAAMMQMAVGEKLTTTQLFIPIQQVLFQIGYEEFKKAIIKIQSAFPLGSEEYETIDSIHQTLIYNNFFK